MPQKFRQQADRESCLAHRDGIMIEALCRDCIEGISLPAGCFGAPGDAPAVPLSCPHCGSRRVLAHPELLQLDIAHIDCDAFYASVEKRDDPSLDGKPVIVGHPGGRGVVTTACYIARQSGIHSAMPMFKAIRACPEAIIVKPGMAKYKAVSQQLRAIFRSVTPVIEPLSLDEAYLDLRPDVRTDARPAALLLADLSQQIETNIGVSVSIGLGANKFLAKLASDMQKPRGFSVIGVAEAKSLLAPLSVRKIMGVGEATARRMEERGLLTIADLQRLPEQQLISEFGKFGRRLAKFAHGLDDRTVSNSRQTKSVSAETTFARDTASASDLKTAATRLCERVTERLQRAELAGGAVILKLKTEDFTLLTRTQRFSNPTQRLDLFVSAAENLIDKEADGRRFRLIGIGAGDITAADEADPPDLFSS